jgi:hypothetical protein
MPKSTQKNFRMSSKAVELLRQVATQHSLSETEVMEHCIARYAGEVGVDVERAKSLLLEHFTKTIAAGKSKRR